MLDGGADSRGIIQHDRVERPVVDRVDDDDRGPASGQLLELMQLSSVGQLQDDAVDPRLSEHPTQPFAIFSDPLGPTEHDRQPA